MTLAEFFAQIEEWPLSTTVAGSDLLFPAIETLHVLAIVLVAGTILIVDLRLLRVASKERAVSELVKEVLPWTWSAFAVAVFTGSLMFVSAATKYSHVPAFQLKMVALLIAGVNMAVFHLGAYRRVAGWDSTAFVPIAARVAGALSLFIWVLVIALGRWIGFTS
jgi:hypothetical protein